MERELTDWLDKYAHGTLTMDERRMLEERLVSSNEAKRFAEEHGVFISALKAYSKREQLHGLLDNYHDQIPDALDEPVKPAKSTRIVSIWPLMAVAASVALISTVATILITRYYHEQQQAPYRDALRGLEKSQKEILADIKERKRPNILPAKFAGTGFMISPKGYIVTGHHVVKDADSVFIENEEFGRLKVTVLLSDAEHDVALMKIVSENFEAPRALPFMVSGTEASLGEEVFTLGFPREDVVFGEGSVSALTGYQQNPSAYQISIPVNPGNSGGPLLNEKGDLIGIISGYQQQTSGTAFAIKSTMLKQVIENFPTDSLNTPIVLPKQNSLRNINRVEQVKRWKEFVFMVRVYN
jgi:serine protease Do